MASLKDLLNKIRSAQDESEARTFIADALNVVNKETEEMTQRQNSLFSTFQQMIINAGDSNFEIVAGRYDNITNKSFDSIPNRLNDLSARLLDQLGDIYTLGVKVEWFIPNSTEAEPLWDWSTAISKTVEYVKKNKINRIIFPSKEITLKTSIIISGLDQTSIEMSKCKIIFSGNMSSLNGEVAAIAFRDCTDCIITGVFVDIEENERHYNGIQVINSKRTRFIKPKVLNATWAGFSIYDESDFTSEDIILDDPVIEYCRYGFVENGLRTTINNGYISNHWSESSEALKQGERPVWKEDSKFWDGVITRGKDWKFNKTVIRDNGQSGIYSGNTVGGSLNGVIIEKNWNNGIDFGPVGEKPSIALVREITIDGSCVIRNNRTGDVHLNNTDYVTILPGALIERTDTTYDDFDKYSQACIIFNGECNHNNISEVIINQKHSNVPAIFVNNENRPSRNNVFINNRITAKVRYKVNVNRNVIVDNNEGLLSFKNNLAFEQAVKSAIKQNLSEFTGFLGREFLNVVISDDNAFGQLTANKPIRILKTDGSRQDLTVGKLILDSMIASGSLYIHPNGTLILPQTPNELKGGIWYEENSSGDGELKYYAGRGVVKTIASK